MSQTQNLVLYLRRKLGVHNNTASEYRIHPNANAKYTKNTPRKFIRHKLDLGVTSAALQDRGFGRCSKRQKLLRKLYK